MSGRSHCVECPRTHQYKRSELYFRSKRLYCKRHAEDVDRSNLVTCFGCPSTHDGWPKSEIRRRKGMDYCTEHLPPDPKKWPDCPKCGNDDFGRFIWKGSVKKTTITCEECGFSDLAVNHFDAVTVKVIASPIEDTR